MQRLLIFGAGSLAKIISRMKRVLPSLVQADEERVLLSQLEARTQARRSLVTKHALEVGHVLTGADLICKRPGTGISPLVIEDIVGQRIAVDLKEDTILDHSHLVRE